MILTDTRIPIWQPGPGMKCSGPRVVRPSVVYFPSASLHYVSRENFLFLWLDPRQIGIRVWYLTAENWSGPSLESRVRFRLGPGNEAEYWICQRCQHYKITGIVLVKVKCFRILIGLFAPRHLRIWCSHDWQYSHSQLASFNIPENTGVDIFWGSCWQIRVKAKPRNDEKSWILRVMSNQFSHAGQNRHFSPCHYLTAQS